MDGVQTTAQLALMVITLVLLVFAFNAQLTLLLAQ